MSKNSKSAGFAVFEVLIVVVVLVLIGFVGYTIYNRQNADKTPGTSQLENDPAVANDVQEAPEVKSEEDLDKAEKALDDASLDSSLSDSEELDDQSSDL